MSRFRAVKPGESKDPEINKLLDDAKDGWWKDTSMFGVIAREPILLKTIVPVFEAFFIAGRIPPHVFEMMRLKTGEINDCTYCKTVRAEAVRETVKEKEKDFFGEVNFDKLPRAEALAVKLAEYMAGDPNYIPDGFFDQLREYYSEEQIVELVFGASIFNWGNKFNITMQVDSDDQSAYPKHMEYPGANVRKAEAVGARA